MKYLRECERYIHEDCSLIFCLLRITTCKNKQWCKSSFPICQESASSLNDSMPLGIEEDVTTFSHSLFLKLCYFKWHNVYLIIPKSNSIPAFLKTIPWAEGSLHSRLNSQITLKYEKVETALAAQLKSLVSPALAATLKDSLTLTFTPPNSCLFMRSGRGSTKTSKRFLKYSTYSQIFASPGKQFLSNSLRQMRDLNVFHILDKQ